MKECIDMSKQGQWIYNTHTYHWWHRLLQNHLPMGRGNGKHWWLWNLWGNGIGEWGCIFNDNN